MASPFDDTGGYYDYIPADEPGQPQSDPRYQGVLSQWKDAVADFDNVYQRHIDNWGKARDLGMLAEWDAQSVKLSQMEAAIATIADKLNGVSSYTRRVFGMSALSALPLVPIAIIVGSISAVTAITFAVASWNSELERKWNFVRDNPGMTAKEVGELLNSGESPLATLTSGAASITTWIVIGGLLLVFLPEMMKGRK